MSQEDLWPTVRAPAPEDPEMRELVGRCAEAMETEGPEALETFCEQHPARAEEVRERIAVLVRAGLLGERPGTEVSFPDRLGEFELLERLGGGGMGVVFRARQRSLNREVALKVVRPGQLFVGEARERFRREVSIVARLQHPAIVPVYAVGEEAGVPYFAMELVPGCTLAEALGELATRDPGRLQGIDLAQAVAARAKTSGDPGDRGAAWMFEGNWVDVCCRLASQVADALEHAHRRGVIHRDVKPSNIMLTSTGRVMLLDFGLSARLDASRITNTGTILGTLAYMPPEQLRGNIDQIGVSSDVYSLGVTLYEALTLRPAFEGKTTEALAHQVLDSTPPRPRSLNPTVSWDAETVCLAAMDRDPDRRYPAAADLRRDLMAVIERRPIEARRPAVWIRIHRWMQRRPAHAVALALGFVILVVGPTLFAVREAAARRRIEAALRESEASRVQADGNFNKAVEALELVTDVSRHRLASVPRFEGLRREILEAALAFHLALLEERGDDPKALWETARAWRAVGNIRADLDDTDGALSAFESALAAARHLRQESGSEPRYAHEVARGLIERARALCLAGRYVEAEAPSREALGLVGEEASGGETEEEKELRGTVRDRLAIVLKMTGVLDEAKTIYEQELAAREAALAAHPDSTEQRHRVAYTLTAFGQLLQNLDSSSRAETCLARSVDLWRDLAADHPDDPRYRSGLYFGLNSLANLLITVGRAQEAEPHQRDALHHANALAADFPGMLFRRRAAGARLNLGVTLSAQNRFDEADSTLSEARAEYQQLFSDHPGNSQDHEGLAAALVYSGVLALRHRNLEDAAEFLKQAIRHIRRAPDKKPDQRVYRKHLRDASVMLATLLETLDREEQVDEYARRVAELLEEVLRQPREAYDSDPDDRRAERSLREALILASDVTRLPRHEYLVAYTDEWLALPTHDGKHCRTAADMLARCATLVRQDRTLSPQERRQACGTYAGQAISWLERAFERGYDEAEEVATAPTLAPLREQERFKVLLESMRRKDDSRKR